MTLDRRSFTRLLAVGAGSLVLPRSLTAGLQSRLGKTVQPTFFQWQSVAEGVRVAMGQGGNVMLVSNGSQALISDAKNFGFGHSLRREADAMGTPVTMAVNTHHHGDHTGGNIAFTGDLPVLAHPVATQRILGGAERSVGQAGAERLTTTLERSRSGDTPPAVIADLERALADISTAGVERAAPTQDLAGDHQELRIGGRTVTLTHVGAGHTDNDVFLHLPELNVIHTGDLVFNGSHGFMDQNGGVDSVGWQRSVRAMLDVSNSETVVIPGHGQVTDRTGLQRQWDYFDQLRDAVLAAVGAGLTREEVQALRPEALSDIQGNPSRNLGVVYDEVTAGG